MRKKVTLITGANGEVGHGLIQTFAQLPDALPVVVIDIRSLDPQVEALVEDAIIGDILDMPLLDKLMMEYEIDTIYHLAALLSTHSEFRPEAAHRVNVQGTINLLHLAYEQSHWHGSPVKFVFPSSIAVYGLPDVATKQAAPPLTEDQYLTPTTMYGCNKLYCEHLGRYYSRYYRQLAAAAHEPGVDFRCVRFPGLISATTMPTGGTSDYAPEMIHAAAQGKAYECFVRPNAVIPFMVMPDGIKALLDIARVPREQLTRHVYNVTGFSLSAQEIAHLVREAFPGTNIAFQGENKRQAIVDTWPAEIDDSAARRDWGWRPDYDARRAFTEYLIPTIQDQYKVVSSQ